MCPLDTAGDAPTLEGCTHPKDAWFDFESMSASEIKQPRVSMLQPDGAVIGGWRASGARLRPGLGGGWEGMGVGMDMGTVD